VLQRERQEPVEVVNERYARRKGLKAEERRAREEDADE
jgi:tRNA pseudouridine38/39 synthase